MTPEAVRHAPRPNSPSVIVVAGAHLDHNPRHAAQDGKGLGHQTAASPIPFVLACPRGS